MPSQLPSGFKFSGVACGIKPSGKKDLALIATDEDSVAAGVYTTNIVHASSIVWNRDLTPTDQFRAIVVNSGNANACTGKQGETDNQHIAELVAQRLGVQANQICVLSTGIIGQKLPMDQVESGIEDAAGGLGDSCKDFLNAAEAILTTDKGIKKAFRITKVDDDEITILGMAKGAGMIGPRMATMLAVVMTDAKLNATMAQMLVQQAADASFNRISVEGHMSTNDALILISSGKSSANVSSGPNLQALSGALNDTCLELAKQIPADGEGASHAIEVSVVGARSDKQADAIARSVAASNLVKTAITGNDPNWGRIVSAAGYCGADFKISEVSLKLNGHCVFKQGQPLEFDEREVNRAINDSFETLIELTVGEGTGNAQHWTSDLTTAYVAFNSEYST